MAEGTAQLVNVDIEPNSPNIKSDSQSSVLIGVKEVGVAAAAKQMDALNMNVQDADSIETYQASFQISAAPRARSIINLIHYIMT